MFCNHSFRWLLVLRWQSTEFLALFYILRNGTPNMENYKNLQNYIFCETRRQQWPQIVTCVEKQIKGGSRPKRTETLPGWRGRYHWNSILFFLPKPRTLRHWNLQTTQNAKVKHRAWLKVSIQNT